MAPTSFMSEHTIEYALVHKLSQILSRSYDKIIPICLWLTREGNNKGLASLRDEWFKLLAVYPRRPKVEVANEGPLLVKFNDHVLVVAREHQNRGIPVVAGIPLVAGLSSFRLDSACTWFEILGHDLHDGDIHLSISLDGQLPESLPGGYPIRGPINESQIARLVSSKSEAAEWSDWVAKIRDARKGSKDPYGRSCGLEEPTSLSMFFYKANPENSCVQ